MPKPKLGDIETSIVDPLLSDNFQLAIPNIPTGDSSVPFLMQCRTVTKPGVTMTNVEVQLFGHTTEHAGNKTYGHDLTVEYVENRKCQITRTLENWAEMIRSTQGQHGAYKAEYARKGYLTVFDQKGMAVDEYVIEGMWPGTVPDTQFDGSSSQLISLSATFKYDYYYNKTTGMGAPSS